MPTELEVIASQLEKAGSYMDVFGGYSGDSASQMEHIKRTFRRLAKTVHPDHFSDGQKELASKAFANLHRFQEEALTAVEAGRYGKAPIVSIKTKKFEHKLGNLLSRGDIADLYDAESVSGGSSTPSVVKIARHPKDSDLLEAEASALRQILVPGDGEEYHAYFPRLLDSLVYQDAGRGRRNVNVTGKLNGFYNLQEVRDAYPSGVNHLDAIWMWRRLLVAIGYAHRKGMIHGAILPQHVMILPEDHGLALVDWCYSTIVSQDSGTQPIKALSPEHREWYPKEVIDKSNPTYGTDICLSVRTLVYLMGGNPITLDMPDSIPRPLRAFFKGCCQEDQRYRPQDAWGLLREFDELLERMGNPYFPRRFRQFVVPTI